MDLFVSRLVKAELVDILDFKPEVYPGVPDPVTAYAIIGIPKGASSQLQGAALLGASEDQQNAHINK